MRAMYRGTRRWEKKAAWRTRLCSEPAQIRAASAEPASLTRYIQCTCLCECKHTRMRVDGHRLQMLCLSHVSSHSAEFECQCRKGQSAAL